MADIENFDWEAFEREPLHPFHTKVIKTIPFVEFIKNFHSAEICEHKVWYKDAAHYCPAIRFTDIDHHRTFVFNIRKLSFFEIIRLKEKLFVEENEKGCLFLRIMEDDEELSDIRFERDLWAERQRLIKERQEKEWEWRSQHGEPYDFSED